MDVPSGEKEASRDRICVAGEHKRRHTEGGQVGQEGICIRCVMQH